VKVISPAFLMSFYAAVAVIFQFTFLFRHYLHSNIFLE
jgi:hypothetical protein